MTWQHQDSASLMDLLQREPSESQLNSIQSEIQSLDRLIQASQDRDFLPLCQSELLRQRMLGSETLSFSRLQVIPDKDRKIVENWIKANEQITAWVVAGEFLTLSKLQQIHSLLEGVTDPSPWRSRPIQLGDTPCAPFEDLPRFLLLFDEFYQSSKDQVHPVILSARVYQWLISIHFFEDTNGRLARLVADWILALEGYPPVSFEDEKDTYVFVSPSLPENFLPGHETSIIVHGVRNTLRILFGV
jgi:hypothetical protein